MYKYVHLEYNSLSLKSIFRYLQIFAYTHNVFSMQLNYKICSQYPSVFFVLRSSQSFQICTPTHPQSQQSKHDHFSHDLLISESIPNIISYYICHAYVVACARNIYVGVFVHICTIMHTYVCAFVYTRVYMFVKLTLTVRSQQWKQNVFP